ncbi:MAG TPA: tRNA lysidine(34) synthetase TilS [Candidatus Binataceae bacterium]|nr:tRNA lysidine(34) synthetase TilS [Candidatus Binataceae bacterium]
MALSGGPDSVALLYAMRRGGHRIAAAHLNHHLRGAESDRDESFVRRLCDELGIELIVEQAALGRDSSNLEERARDARHDFLDRAADRLAARYIALGHQADDQAETIMLRMLRGAGIAGLSAMAECGPGRLIRPLLRLRRCDLAAYLEALGAQFVSDSSNRSPRHLRNRVRIDLLPAIEHGYAPGFSRRLVELGAEVRAVDDFLSASAERELNGRLTGDQRLNLSGFPGLHPALMAAMLRKFIADRIGTLRRVDRSHLQALMRLCLEGPSNGSIDLPGKWCAIREYETLVIRHIEENLAERYAVPLALNGRTEIAPSGFTFEAAVLAADAAPMPDDLYQALFDADQVAAPMVARSALPGDRIAPLGMTGSRKVKEVFIDGKVPLRLRGRYPLIEIDGQVAWIPGLVRSRLALLHSYTQKVLRLKALFFTH